MLPTSLLTYSFTLFYIFLTSPWPLKLALFRHRVKHHYKFFLQVECLRAKFSYFLLDIFASFTSPSVFCYPLFGSGECIIVIIIVSTITYSCCKFTSNSQTHAIFFLSLFYFHFLIDLLLCSFVSARTVLSF